MKNLYVEKSSRKLGCGAVVTRFRETVFDEDDEEFSSLREGVYFKDDLWDDDLLEEEN